MNLTPLTNNAGGQQNFRLGIIPGTPTVVVIATQNLSEQARYVADALGSPAPGSPNVIWMGVFQTAPGVRVSDFAGPAQYRSVMMGRYQYVVSSGGRPYVITLNVTALNHNIVPPSGVLRPLP